MSMNLSKRDTPNNPVRRRTLNYDIFVFTPVRRSVRICFETSVYVQGYIVRPFFCVCVCERERERGGKQREKGSRLTVERSSFNTSNTKKFKSESVDRFFIPKRKSFYFKKQNSGRRENA